MELFLNDLLSGAPMLWRTLAAIVLAAVACGIIGTHVVLRRDSYAVGAISHSLLGGVGCALFLQSVAGWRWFTPWCGALAAGLVAALLLTLSTCRWKMRQDTVLSAIWALGIAIGISFITAIPGYPPDMDSYLFASILLIAPEDLLLMLVLDLLIAAIAYAWHHRIVTLSFNSELLELRGVSIFRTQLALQLMVAMTVVLLAQIVGVILCMALLILPAAAAAAIFRRIPMIMAGATLLCLCAALGGVVLSYDLLPGGVHLAPGATIVELAGLAYLLAVAYQKLTAAIARKKSTPAPAK